MSYEKNFFKTLSANISKLQFGGVAILARDTSYDLVPPHVDGNVVNNYNKYSFT